MRGSGALRSLVTAAAGAGLVLWSPQVPSVSVAVSTSPTGAAQRAAAAAGPGRAGPVPVTAAQLSCAGLGASGAPSTVLVATAPAAALPGRPPGGVGQVAAGPLQAASTHTRLERRGGVWSGRAGAATDVTATGALAGATVAAERVRLGGKARALLGTTCGSASMSSWLVGGGAQAGRRERVLLVNPGAVAASVDLAVLGAKGPVSSANGVGVVVAPRSRRVVALDAIAGSERAPVVHVRSFGAAVYAVLTDSWLDGLVPRGADATGATAPPAREQVMTGVSVDGPAAVRIAVPGVDAASVQVRVLTPSGPRAVPSGGQLRLAGGSTRDLDLSGLPAGSYAVQVRSTVPVVAGALVESASRHSRHSDLAWSAAGEPVSQLAGTALGPQVAAPLTTALSLAAVGEPARVTVSTVRPDGTTHTGSVRVPPDSVVLRPLARSASVWVTPRSGRVRAAVVTSTADPHGRLVTVSPLADLSLTTPSVAFREVGG